MIARRFHIMMLLCSLLGACSTKVPLSYADPKQITVGDALTSVANGIADYNDQLIRRDVSTTNLVDQVEITLNVSASATGKSELVVDAKSPEAVTVIPFGIKYTDGLETGGSRGSIVKLTLKNLYTADLNKPGEAVARRDGPGLRKVRRFSRPIEMVRPPSEPLARIRTDRSTALEQKKNPTVPTDNGTTLYTLPPRESPPVSLDASPSSPPSGSGGGSGGGIGGGGSILLDKIRNF